MRRLILLACLLVLSSGCGKSAKSDNKLASGDGTRKELSKEATPLDVAKDYLTGAGLGSDIQEVSKEEKAVTLNKKPAVALHLQWRGKGDTEAKNDLFIIQDQRVKDFIPYDAAKSLEENISTAVQKLEAP